jgi:hypothetical protein
MTPSKQPLAQRTNGQRKLDGRPLTPSIKTTNEGPSGERHHPGMMGAIISDWVGGIVGMNEGSV